MTKLNVFEHIKWGCKTHPHDINPRDYLEDEEYVDVDSGERLESFKTFIEDKGCNWEWYCEVYELNPQDENGIWIYTK